MTTNTINSSVTSTVMHDVERGDLLRWLGVLMALIGIGISLYLSYVKLADTEVTCVSTGVIDCKGVQSSAYASFFGVPIAYLGVAGYGMILGMLLLNDRINFLADYGTALLFSVTLFGFTYSAYLIYVEAFILEKWCQWCVASALLMTGLFVLSGVRLFRSMQTDEFDETDEAEA